MNTKKIIYPWYDIVGGREKVLQGDFIKNCPILIPPDNIREENRGLDAEIFNVIVLSQSCDLIQKRIELVLVCPYITLKEMGERNSLYAEKRGKEELRKGFAFGYHLLNKCKLKGFKSDFFVVDFRNVYSIHFKSLNKIAKKRGKRLRLIPPYREHLSQAFARFFMRVGLPVDIRKFR